jgi:hypothetical protein
MDILLHKHNPKKHEINFIIVEDGIESVTVFDALNCFELDGLLYKGMYISGNTTGLIYAVLNDVKSKYLSPEEISIVKKCAWLKLGTYDIKNTITFGVNEKGLKITNLKQIDEHDLNRIDSLFKNGVVYGIN